MNLYNDTFTDVAGQPLASHTSNSGATYSAHPAYAGSAAVEVVTGSRVRGAHGSSYSNIFNVSQRALGPDHALACTVYVAATGQAEDTGVLCRVTPTGNGRVYALTIYNGNARLYKNVNGTYTQLGSNVSLSETAGTTYALTLTCQGATITGTVTRHSDGFYLTSSGAWQAAQASVFTLNDTSVPLTNNLGLWIGSTAGDADSAGYQMASASLLPALALTPLEVIDVMAGFGAQGVVRGSVADGSISGNTLTSATAGFQAGDVGKDICIANGNSAPPVFNAARQPAGAQAPPSTPTLCCCCCAGSLPTTKYYVVITWESYTGEGGPSPALEKQIAGVEKALQEELARSRFADQPLRPRRRIQRLRSPTRTVTSCAGT